MGPHLHHIESISNFNHLNLHLYPRLHHLFDVEVSKLREELQGDDYKQKLGGLVSQLYKLAFQTYHDIPRGPIKDNLMRKLACKTLMEILPAEVGTKISEEIKEKKLSVDFDTVVGLVVG